ncbi:uncharacterized protein Bfra_000380 [Botrytis fragariae]|uniref:OTU domain-containing protein n=1 Tax=Botrytis fragariae TaxID=1964551 RepID=A0A8H6B2K9_9HELO|nr:uncharacterized protein Bfra_000380 [Botrytis fragariae]KAF5878214.1 hypothetical protein Bfra_000380 [Botrytis fragariae]
MNEEELARVLRRDPNINVARPLYQRPERTEPLKWAPYTPHTMKQSNLPRYITIRTTEPLQWIPREHIKSAWPLLPQRPPVFPELPVKKHGLEQFEVEEARKRQRKETRRAQKEAEMAKLVPPPAPRPEIMPLSPQAVRTPRPIDPSTEARRKKWSGPGDWEFKWKHNPRQDANMAVRDSIPDDMYEPPIVRSMPDRIPINKNLQIEISFMEGVIFYPSRIPASGDCFFGSVSMALYGTTLYWHYTKYCHLWFFRYVLTHPAHPRYDFYWHLNSIGNADDEMNMWERLNTPHAWQSSELFNVTADIYNLFVVLYEAPATIDLFGQYNATHTFFHLINRNHYESLIPKDKEIQFPFPDGVMVSPRPGRAKLRLIGGGRNIVPPPIALPVIPLPSLMDMTRVLGINTAEGALDIELVKTGLRRERRLAKELNDPAEIKWWVEAEAKEKEDERKAEEKRIADAAKTKTPKKVKLPTNEQLAADLARVLAKGKKPEPGKVTKEDPNNLKSKKIPKRIVHDLNSDDEDNYLDEAENLIPENQHTPGGTKKKRKFTGFGLDYDDDDSDDDDESDLYEAAKQTPKKSPTVKPPKTPGNPDKKSSSKTVKAKKRPPRW